MDVKQAIEHKNTALSNAYNQGDAAGCAAVFTEDALFLPPNQPLLRGKKAIQELIQGWIDHICGTMINPMTECGVAGGLAFQVATYAFKDTMTPDQGKFVEIFRLQPEGSWKVYFTIYNSDKPL
jgi:uncharacterized protein (TIGR02246 family)